MSGDELGIDNLADVEIIGRGGFSVVYAATDTQFDRRVAVKVLGRLISESDRRRFDAECRVMGRLSTHRNVVTVHSAGYTREGNPYLLMELIEGGTLADRLAAVGRVPWPEALDVVRPIADALGRAHEAGILHRDVKPENILMAGDEPRLTDFGIAYLRDATGATSTHITASWLHTAPETFTDSRDERSDLYSLASTAHTLIAGVAPFWRRGEESLNPLMYRLLNEPPPGLPAGLAPPELSGFLQRGLAKDPSHRSQTAAGFVDELDAIRSRAVASAVPQLGGPPPGPGRQDPPVAIADPHRPRSGGRRDWWKIGLATAAVVVIAMAAVLAIIALGGEPAGASEVVLEPIASVGQDPFTNPAVPGAPSGPGPASGSRAGPIIEALNTAIGRRPATDFSGVVLPDPPGDATINVAGSAPGLYGGTNIIDVCDRDALVGFLASDQTKGDAWASVHGITREEIPGYVAGLTDVILQVDTRVTNHGYRDGSPVAVDSVLQAGTAVLIDEFGVPRVRCFCGNPLLEARSLASGEPTLTGTAWDGFALDQAVIVSPVDPVTELVLDDMISDDLLARAPGADASQAQPIGQAGGGAGESQTTTSSPPSTVATSEQTATTRPLPQVITGAGAVAASSDFPGGEFPAALAADGSDATSWFSAGGGTATYSWDLGGRAAFIDAITVVGNSAHPQFPTNFGFGAVTVTVLDGATEVSSQTFELPGTPDPDITARPGVTGTRIVLDFSGGEDPSCGGFAELVVSGSLE